MEGSPFLHPYVVLGQAHDKQRRYQDEAVVGRLWLMRERRRLAAALRRWQTRLERGGEAGDVIGRFGYPERMS